MNNLPDVTKYVTDDIVSRFAEVHQPRSDFQLEKFVLGAHETDEMRYVQCINEIQSLYYTIKQVTLELKKTEIEIQRLKSSGDEIDAIEAQIKELGIEQTRVVGVGAFRELETLLVLLSKFPRFTREQIEKSQSDYWAKRLEKQAMMEVLGGSQASASQLLALSQIGLFSAEETLAKLNKKEIE
jgi:hypothetical protein